MFQSWGAEVVSMKFLRLEAAIIDFDVRMPLHYTVIIKRKSLYFIFIRMFNYLSNHYFETKSNKIDRLFLLFTLHLPVCIDETHEDEITNVVNIYE